MPMMMPVFLKPRGSPSIVPPAALIAATVAFMSVTFRITCAIGSFTASLSRCMITIGSPRLALAVSAVAPKFTKISGPPGTSMRLTSCIPNADW